MARKQSVILADGNQSKETLKNDVKTLENELRDLEKARAEELRTHVANMERYERDAAALRRKIMMKQEKLDEQRDD